MASVKIIDTSVASGDTGGDVFDSPNGTYVKALALNTDWEYEDTQTVDGQIWYDLGGDQWISEIYAAPNITDLEVRSGTAKVAGFTTATVYYSTNGSENTQDNPTPLPENSEWLITKPQLTAKAQFGLMWAVLNGSLPKKLWMKVEAGAQVNGFIHLKHLMTMLIMFPENKISDILDLDGLIHFMMG
ncbi:hypothetical protein JCM14202_3742 [Agrilactobacillus composti DSM 18527 = JCM 14202]|uniref:hypothetical protein n=1 Tax=Agrilactobacillus composti TaxID=398555 RepID=UPI00042E061A|nr:hypothetical protein [Agrilactobacillus composti]GAF41783.1 hypothetical protein JCM14202_3742 [Agrilactobacillus composti DSM 18527 = JCM 14202]